MSEGNREGLIDVSQSDYFFFFFLAVFFFATFLAFFFAAIFNSSIVCLVWVDSVGPQNTNNMKDLHLEMQLRLDF